jgi:translation initiation factor 4G
MIKDVIELRGRQWVARIKKVEAKKISDIHKEANKEAAAAALAERRGGRGSKPPTSAPSTPKKAGKPDKVDRPGAPTGAAQDWETVPSKPGPKWKKGQDARSAPGSRTATPQKAGKSNKTETPSKGSKARDNAANANNATGAGTGINGVSDLAGKKEVLRAEVNNAFSVLDAEEAETAENEEDGTSNSNAGDAENKDKQPEQDNSEPSDDSKVESDVSQEDEEKIRFKLKGALREYFSSGVKDDFKLTVQELPTPGCNHYVVSDGFQVALEAKDKERTMLSELLTTLYSDKVLSAAHIRKGFTTVLDQAEDLIFDYPKLLEHLATVMTSLIIANAVPLSFLVSPATVPIQDSGKGAKLLAEVLLAVQGAQGDEALKTLFKADIAPKFQSYLKDEDPAKFLQEKKLDVLVACI